MSFYSQNLKKEINHLKDSIKRNNNNIKVLKEEIKTNIHVYRLTAHSIRIAILTWENTRLEAKMEEVSKSIF